MQSLVPFLLVQFSVSQPERGQSRKLARAVETIDPPGGSETRCYTNENRIEFARTWSRLHE